MVMNKFLISVKYVLGWLIHYKSGLVQAITWTNDDKGLWCNTAWLGHDELKGVIPLNYW